MSSHRSARRRLVVLAIAPLASLLLAAAAAAQTLYDPKLSVSTVVSGLEQPTALAFVGPDDLLVLEKVGRVRRVLNGVLQATPARTVITNASGETGLLGIAVNGETPRQVFLYYTEAATPDGALIANRVYRYTWSASTGLLQNPQLILDLPVAATSHHGGALLLGPPADGSLLHVVIGDLDRDGQLENYAGGSAPDDTAVVLRVRQDGSAAPGNPFTPYCAGATSQTCSSHAACGANGPCRLGVAKYFAYGVRNGFGMALDPLTGDLWSSENGPDHWDELNHVAPGFNSGWERIMGPASEDPEGTGDLWNMPGAGSTYSDPEFSFQLTLSPTGVVVPWGSSLGPAYNKKLLVGAFNNAQLYAFPLNAARDGFDFAAFPDLMDKVADNQGEANQLRIGSGFGGTFSGITDLEIGPDLALYVVSIGGSVFRVTGPGPPPVPALGALGLAALALLVACAAALALSSSRSR